MGGRIAEAVEPAFDYFYVPVAVSCVLEAHDWVSLLHVIVIHFPILVVGYGNDSLDGSEVAEPFGEFNAIGLVREA